MNTQEPAANEGDGKTFLAPWASVYGLLVAIAKMPWAPLPPLAPTGREVLAKRINEHAGKDIP